MTIIDFRESVASANDPANKDMLGRVQSRAFRMMMFCETQHASWAADRLLKTGGYPSAQISFPANRKAFRYEVGDSFVLTYTPYGIANMVCRVLHIQEEGLGSENILITALEDPEYIADIIKAEGPDGEESIPASFTPVFLTHVKVIEAPYVSVGNTLYVIPLAAKEIGIEAGYYLYMSVDGGASYIQIGTIGVFNPHGTLVSSYPADTIQIDDEIGFEVDFTYGADLISTVVRDLLFAGNNMALLGDEIISFQTITAVAGDRYAISGVFRGRFDTLSQTHAAGTSFFYLGTSYYRKVVHPELNVGSVRYFKMVPFTIKEVGTLADAAPVALAIAGRAKKPYLPWNFMCCARAIHAEYPCSTTSTTSSTTV